MINRTLQASQRTALRGNQYGAPVPIDIIVSTISARHRERYPVFSRGK
jgi:hypothetical protein